MHDDVGGPLPLQVEMLSASLRADTTDLNAFMEAIASKLQGALPNSTRVERHSSLFSREHPIKTIQITLGDLQYSLQRERKGPVIALRARVVRGIVLQTDQIAVEQWIDELALSLAEEAAKSALARMALERFLL